MTTSQEAGNVAKLDIMTYMLKATQRQSIHFKNDGVHDNY